MGRGHTPARLRTSAAGEGPGPSVGFAAARAGARVGEFEPIIVGVERILVEQGPAAPRHIAVDLDCFASGIIDCVLAIR